MPTNLGLCTEINRSGLMAAAIRNPRKYPLMPEMFDSPETFRIKFDNYLNSAPLEHSSAVSKDFIKLSRDIDAHYLDEKQIPIVADWLEELAEAVNSKVSPLVKNKIAFLNEMRSRKPLVNSKTLFATDIGFVVKFMEYFEKKGSFEAEGVKKAFAKLYEDMGKEGLSNSDIRNIIEAVEELSSKVLKPWL